MLDPMFLPVLLTVIFVLSDIQHSFLLAVFVWAAGFFLSCL